MAGVSDLDRITAGIGENFALRRIQRPTIDGLSPLKRMSEVSIPLLLIHGEIDEIVPVGHGRDAAKALAAAGETYRYVEVPGLDHVADRFSSDHKRQVYGALVQWLGREDCLGAG